MAKNVIYNFFISQIDFKKKNKPVNDFISKFVSDNMSVISSDGFIKRMTFGNDKKNELIDIYDADNTKWKAIVVAHPVLNISENTKSILNQEIMCHYITNNDHNLLKFMALRIFTSCYYKAFPKYVVEARMKAALNSLSNKFFIKKYGTLDKAIDALLNTYKETYTLRFKKHTDDDIIYLINALVTRVNIFVKNVQRVYYNTTDAVFEDKEVMTRESQRITTNDTIVLENILKKVYGDEMLHGYDTKLIRSIENGPIMIPILVEIYKNDANAVKQMIHILMYDYLENNNNITIEIMYKEFLKFTFSTRKRNPEYDVIVNDLYTKYVTSANIKPDRFKFFLTKYFGIQLFKCISNVHHNN